MTRREWLCGRLIESVAFRLARADQLEYELGLTAAEWSRDPLSFIQRRRDDGRLNVVVTGIRPIPPEISILFSEVVHQLRCAVDNTVYFLVEEQHGPLTNAEALSVAMPIYEERYRLQNWAKGANQKGVSELAPDTQLYTRIESLQPFASDDKVPSISPVLGYLMGVTPVEAHPLLLLQAYSNWDKHRAIRAAAVRTFVQNSDERFWESDRSMRPLDVGDVIAVATPGRLAMLEATTAAHVERPGTDVWVAVGVELAAIHAYVAGTLIPTLVTGSPDDVAFPFTIDLEDSGASADERLHAGGDVSAHQRVGNYVASVAREPEPPSFIKSERTQSD